MIELGHEGHQGMAKMKQRFRTKFWWPGIDKKAEAFCRTCHGCQVVGGTNHPEPPHITELPQGPWQSIAIDFMGPLPSGNYVFTVTDCYSRYVEVSIPKKKNCRCGHRIPLKKCLRPMVCPTQWQVIMVLISWQNLSKNS